MTIAVRLTLAATAFLLTPLPLAARVTEFHITGQTPLADAPDARRITATVSLALDPHLPQNRIIVDLDRAPRDAAGMVEAAADLQMLIPPHPNGTMILEFPNRGKGQIYGALDDLTQAQSALLDRRGSGFLLARGYTLVLVAWQGDITTEDSLKLRLPIARGVTGPTRDEWPLKAGVHDLTLFLSWPIADPESLKLKVRDRPDAPPRLDRALYGRLAGDRSLKISRAGDAAEAILQATYVARDPAVMGIGFAAVRDVATFLLHDTSHANPLLANGQPQLTRAIATGISQSGRAVRDFLYFGFNRDEAGHRVFDGILPVVPGTRRTFTNARFAQPGRNPGPEADQLFPVDQFPFTYGATRDPHSGRVDGLLVRCSATRTCPKIIELDSEYEFYGSRASLLVTDAGGGALRLPATVRAYMLAGAPHYKDAFAVTGPDARCLLPTSPIAMGPVLRALTVDLDAWIKDGTLPPPSRYPMVQDGTLVQPAKAYRSGLPIHWQERYLRAPMVVLQPDGPRIAGHYPVLLPATDGDGNAIAGIKLPEVEVPRATYTGWNPQRDHNGPQDLCDHVAGRTPFAATRAARIASSDPRLSIEERYPSEEVYRARLRAAADALVADRLLLPEDAGRAIARAIAAE